ncbi:MAG: 50S ribosomal protein L25/general stress protein Ctc [Pseudomonadota bacterium]
MAEGFALKADVRERTGKGAARALRRDGLIPAVIYGNNEPALAIAIPHKETALALHGGGFLTNVWTIDVGGSPIQALARDFQLEPVKDRLIHVDFLRVTARSRVTVEVPLSFVDEDKSPGLKDGGSLSVLLFTLSVDAAATRIPDAIEVSLDGLEIGATITSNDIVLPADVTIAGQADEPFPVATISAPMAAVSEDEPEAPGEPEIVGEDAADEDDDTTDTGGG